MHNNCTLVKDYGFHSFYQHIKCHLNISYINVKSKNIIQQLTNTHSNDITSKEIFKILECDLNMKGLQSANTFS